MAICPFADQSTRFDGAYGGRYVSGPWRGVLHSTETRGLPGYGGGATAPHFTIDPRARTTWQHFDTARPARALEHRPGTVDTNNLHCIQIEIVAYSDEGVAARVGGTPVSNLTADDYAYIAKTMRWIESVHGIQPTSGLRWKPYPSSYGDRNGVRMSDTAWRGFNGWCGHQHVPHNNHGDPSNLNIDALLEGDMPITDEDAQRIALWVWRYDQQGLKSQAWAYQQRAADQPAPANVTVPAVTDDQLRAALRDVIKEMVK